MAVAIAAISEGMRRVISEVDNRSVRRAAVLSSDRQEKRHARAAYRAAILAPIASDSKPAAVIPETGVGGYILFPQMA